MAFPLVRVAAICASAGYTFWRIKRVERDALREAARLATRDARQD